MGPHPLEVVNTEPEEVPQHQEIKSNENPQDATAIRHERREVHSPLFLLFSDHAVGIEEGDESCWGFNSNWVSYKLYILSILYQSTDFLL